MKRRGEKKYSPQDLDRLSDADAPEAVERERFVGEAGGPSFNTSRPRISEGSSSPHKRGRPVGSYPSQRRVV
jgi:hypothetical protein